MAPPVHTRRGERPVLTALTILAVLAAGYTLGRCRPRRSLARWADHRTRADGRWWLDTTPVAAAVFVATWPRGALYAWRHRHDPPPPRSPAMTFRHVSRTDDTDTTETR